MELKQLSAGCSSADVIVLGFSCTLAPPDSCSMKTSISASKGEKVHDRPPEFKSQISRYNELNPVSATFES